MMDVDQADTADSDDGDASGPSQQFYQQTISVGFYHTCAISNGDELRCFGLGDVEGVDEGTWDVDQAVEPAGEFVQVTSGTMHSCGLKVDGTVECWGQPAVPAWVWRV